MKKLTAVFALALSLVALQASADNTTNHGRFDVLGEVTFVAGEEKPLYPVRGIGCSNTPPSYEEALKWAKPDLPEKLGQLYDAGVGLRESGKCNGALVGARIIGLRVPKEYAGEAKVTFFRFDHVAVKVVATK